MSRLAAASAAALLVSLAAFSAGASVTVLGGGYAEACSRAAIVGQSGPRFEEQCTRSLQDEALDREDRAGTFVNRGVMRLRLTRFEEARRDFDSAIKLKADLGEAYVNRGASLIGLKRYPEALEDLNKGIGFGIEELPKAYFNRGLANEGLGNEKAAYFDYLKAAELDPAWEAPRQELTRFTVSRP